MASLVKRFGSLCWYIQYYENGKLKRQSTGVTDDDEAEDKLVDWKYRRAHPQDFSKLTATPL